MNNKWKELGFPECVIGATPFFVFDAMYDAILERAKFVLNDKYLSYLDKYFSLRPGLCQDLRYTARDDYRSPIAEAYSGIETIWRNVLSYCSDYSSLPQYYKEAGAGNRAITHMNRSFVKNKISLNLQKEWVWDWCSEINLITRVYGTAKFYSTKSEYSEGVAFLGVSVPSPDGSEWKIYGWNDNAIGYIPLQKDENGYFFRVIQKNLKKEELPTYLKNHHSVTQIDVSSWKFPPEDLYWDEVYAEKDEFLVNFKTVGSKSYYDFAKKLQYYADDPNFFPKLT